MTEPDFRTSSYSNNGGDCVEVATNLVVSRGTVPVRDSKAPSGPVLNATPDAFRAFLDGVKADTL
ncbi:DUF397 domain-containing protein [Streptomyces sp. Da 82-17]|uniref:DUF397 domain-containing protein n=1 Tax=Streptomyces sp. Da 82-17 TaxID=3377116 RepID=UPI0038D38DE6